MSSEQEAPDSKSILSGATYNASAPSAAPSSSSSNNTPTAQSALDVLSGVYDPAALHPLADVKKGELDYLLLDDDALNEMEGARGVLPSRGWSDELCYGTGTTYLTGLGFGGLWGLREGLAATSRRAMSAKGPASAVASAVETATSTASTSTSTSSTSSTTSSSPSSTAKSAASQATQAARANAPTPNMKLRLNAILNSVTRRGSFMGNNAGILALLYNGINASMDQYRGKHDIYGSMGAGALTGLIWRSTRGVRPACMAGAGLAAAAGLWTQTKRYLL